ncbi:MAG: hypothetical protein ACLR5Y_05760 [Haemophilus parainfluenzae]
MIKLENCLQIAITGMKILQFGFEDVSGKSLDSHIIASHIPLFIPVHMITM